VPLSRGGSTAAAREEQQLLAIFRRADWLNAVFNARTGRPPYFREFPPGRQYEEWTGKGSAINVNPVVRMRARMRLRSARSRLMLPSQSTGPVTIITPKMLAIF